MTEEPDVLPMTPTSSGEKRARRLFSFDSIKSSGTRRPSHDAQNNDESYRPPTAALEAVRERSYSETSSNSSQSTQPAPLENPRIPSAGNLQVKSPRPIRPVSPGLQDKDRQHALPPLVTNATISASQDPPLSSPSLRRWEMLRQHVMPSRTPSRSTTPVSLSQQASASSSSVNIPPSRPQTPKPSRFGRFGLRHVVDIAQVVTADSRNKIASDIEKACLAARYTEPSKYKIELPYVGTPGSSATLTSFGNTTPLINTFGNKRLDLRRPPSVLSLNHSARPTPSLRTLYQTLLQYAATSGDGPQIEHLPNESMVLSTLLSPFLSSETSPRIDEERLFGFKSFDTILKTWLPEDESGGMQRHLWCTKAAYVSFPQLRARLIILLRETLMLNESVYSIRSPQNFQLILQSLLSLLPTFGDESKILIDLLHQIRLGYCGELDKDAIEEHYGALFVEKDDIQSVRDAIFVESLVKCIDNCTISARRWLLGNGVQTFWFVPHSDSLSPLLSTIHARKLAIFTHGCLTLLLSSTASLTDVQLVSRLIDSRVMPEVGNVENTHDTKLSAVRGNVVRIILQVLTFHHNEDVIQWAASLLTDWYQHRSTEWKKAVEETLKNIILQNQWSAILKILTAVLHPMPDDVRKSIVTCIVPVMNDQLVEDPPPHPCPALTSFMESVSQLYPQIFYKPFFSCAASTREYSVMNYLGIITVVSHFLEDFWTRNAEMIAIALIDVIPSKGREVDHENNSTRGKSRLGQSVLLVELIGRLQAARHVKEASSAPDSVFVDTFKFVVTLEARLSVLLEAKEKVTLIPPSQRLLFLVLFREIRLYTRSLKPATWLSRVVSWFIQYHTDTDIDGLEKEVSESLEQIQGLYDTVRDGVRSTRRSTMLLAPQLVTKTAQSANESRTNLSDLIASRELVGSLAKGFAPKALKLFVAVSALLTNENHRNIGSLLWRHYLQDVDPSTLTASCFLIMQCAEKLPSEIVSTIDVDLLSTSEDTRLEAIQKISTLSMSRFHIMSQHIIMDRAHRPFKLARPPLAFVATDIGSSQFVIGEIVDDKKDGLPIELKRRLAEIGWTDDEAPIDQRQEWIQTPMSLLPSYSLDRMDNSAFDLTPSSPTSRASSPQKSSPDLPEQNNLLRRKSSSGGPLSTMKRRAVFVPALSQIFPRLAALVADPSFAIAALARNTVFELMRNDPNLLTRPIFDLLVGEHKDVSAAVSSLRALFHVRRVLPPSLAHNIFNHLTGFVKHLAKNVDTEEALYDFAAVIPLLAQVTTQVSGLTIRDFRKAKIEVFLMPPGAFWFSTNSPPGPMFPRSLGSRHDPFVDIPPRLVALTIIRTSQNMMLLNSLEKSPQEVQTVRKSMSRLVLPSLSEDVEPPYLELTDFVPSQQVKSSGFDARELKLKVLSTILSRSYIPLVAQIFRSISRHLNDRTELAVLVDGINRILLTHGSDIGIVSQCLIALMVASTRFRRLFNAGGYTLFMPAVIKVYTESESNSGIRLAIEYAISRFYSHHKESFVFQTLDAMSHIIMLPDINGPWIAKGVYSLFSSLKRSITPATPDTAGIHNANREQETEALLFLTADEKPQTFLAVLRRGGDHTRERLSSDLAQIYENGLFGIDNFVRLFLTVIAHDLTIVRAEQFMRFLRLLAPYLYNASASARTVLRDGVDALGVVLFKMSPRNRPPEAPWVRSDDEGVYASMPNLMDQRLLDSSEKPSDLLSIQLDYLSLVAAFVEAGGELSFDASQRAIELVKLLLKESPRDVNEAISIFLASYTKAMQPKLRNVKTVRSLLAEIHPLIAAYALSVDFSGVFKVVSELCNDPKYNNDAAFSQFIVTQVCRNALTACESAATDKLLFTLPSRSALIAMLADAVLLRADIIAEIERRPATYDFLAAILLPLVLSMRTSTELRTESLTVDTSKQLVIQQAWGRLLFYIMRLCQTIHSEFPEGAKLRRRSTSSMNNNISRLPLLLVALQIIKIIVVRAQQDLTHCLPNVWFQLGSFLRSILADGNTDFILRSHSPSPSPSSSPRSSIQIDSFQNPPSIELSTPLHPRAFISPRLVDYCLWSFMELICTHRSPLSLQVRALIQEKLHLLDRDLRQQHASSPISPRGRPLSSVFAKPRRRSGLPSPDVSPTLSPSQLLPPSHSFSMLDYPQSPDSALSYQTIVPSPSVSSQESHGSGLKIVHLGLVSDMNVSPTRSGRPSIRSMAKSTTIKSLSLIRRTYFSIRAVQFIMGYRTLLPIPDTEPDEHSTLMVSQTENQALQSIVDETKDLMDEFAESFDGFDNDAVIVSRPVSENLH